MRKHGFHITKPALSKSLLDYGISDVLRGAGRYRGFDQDKAFGSDLFADDPEAVFQCRDIGSSLPNVSERFFLIIALHINDYNVGKREHIIGVGRNKGLLFFHASMYQGGYFRVFGLNGHDPPVDILDFPKRPRGRPLHPYDELGRFSVTLSTESATTPAITAPTKPTPMTTTI